jgi:hypothetical protein
VVATNVGGLPWIVEPGRTGSLVPPDDVDALAAALRTTDPVLGAAGPQAVERLSPTHVGTALVDAYEGLIGPHRKWGRLLVRVGASVAALIALVACARSISDSIGDARGLHVDLRVVPLMAAVLAVIAAGIVLSAAWVVLVRQLGATLEWRSGLRAWWTGQFGRYLPTGFGPIPARVALARRAGVATRVAAVSTAIESATLVVGCFVVWVTLHWWPVGAVAALAVAFVAVTAVKWRTSISWRSALAYLTALTSQVLLRGLGFWALLAMFTAARPDVGLVEEALAGGYLLGLLAVFAPGGVGVREAAVTAALAPSMGVSAAAGAAIAWRLIESLVEIGLVGATNVANPHR